MEKLKTPEAMTDSSADIIDSYLLGKPVEKVYDIIPGKLSATLRVPTARLMDESDRILYSMQDMATAAVMNNSNLLGTYVSRLGKKDFGKEQGDQYDTPRALSERIEYIQTELLVPLRDILIEHCKNFREWYTDLFSPENLKNF
jgi:hypothetical protein